MNNKNQIVRIWFALKHKGCFYNANVVLICKHRKKNLKIKMGCANTLPCISA